MDTPGRWLRRTLLRTTATGQPGSAVTATIDASLAEVQDVIDALATTATQCA